MCWGILLKIKRNSQLSKIDRFFFGNANMTKIYSRSLSTIIPQRKDWFSFDPPSQTRSGEDSSSMVNRLEIPSVVNFFFLITPLKCFGCFRTWVLFFNRAWKSNCRYYRYIVISHSCWVLNKNALLPTVFVTYFLEVREEAWKNKTLWKEILRHKHENDE